MKYIFLFFALWCLFLIGTAIKYHCPGAIPIPLLFGIGSIVFFFLIRADEQAWLASSASKTETESNENIN